MKEEGVSSEPRVWASEIVGMRQLSSPDASNKYEEWNGE